LLIAYSIEYRIIQRLLQSHNHGQAVPPKLGEGLLGRLGGFMAVAVLLYAAITVILVAGAGGPTWSGLSFTGLLVLVLLRFLVVRIASNMQLGSHTL
jgi:hypothetical protein